METEFDIKELFYPIITNKVLTQFDGSNKLLKIPGKKVLLNSITNYPISIVSDDYEIVTNEEAYKFGLDCFKTLFKLSSEDKIEVYNVISPRSLSFCHIDIICNEKLFPLGREQYMPFIRITNSYNKLFRLYFRVGVCRWICKNGMIFGADAIKFNYNHIKGSKKSINFEIQADNFQKILDRFKSNVEILMKSKPDPDYAFLMFCKGLGIVLNNKTMQSNEERIGEIKSEFAKVLKKYVSELGDNFYSLYNTITDIGTHGFRDEKMLTTKIHSRQSRAGYWLQDIARILRKGKINYEEYLKDYLDSSKN